MTFSIPTLYLHVPTKVQIRTTVNDGISPDIGNGTTKIAMELNLVFFAWCKVRMISVSVLMAENII